MEELAIFTGNSNPALARKICDYLGLPLGGAKVKTFSDGETGAYLGGYSILDNTQGSAIGSQAERPRVFLPIVVR